MSSSPHEMPAQAPARVGGRDAVGRADGALVGANGCAGLAHDAWSSAQSRRDGSSHVQQKTVVPVSYV